MRFLRDALITVVVLIILVTLGALVVVRNGGLSADKAPGRVEQAIATRLVRLSIPSNAAQATSTLTDQARWRDGADHFEDHCAVCHGRDGHGDKEMGDRMYPPVPDLAAAATQQKSDGALFYIIQNGVRWTGMPGWKAEHSPDETWRLVSFIRHVPSMTAAEVASLKADSDHEHEHADDHGHDARETPPVPRQPKTR